MPHDVRDQIVDFVRRWSEKTEIGAGRFVEWLGVAPSRSYCRSEVKLQQALQHDLRLFVDDRQIGTLDWQISVRRSLATLPP